MNKYIGLIKKISSRLEELTHYEKCSYDVLLEAQHYSITAGGKHLRGLILLETAKLGGAQAETVLDFACAMELVHTYSLIHDDLPEMDNDYLRRGKPTCHVKFGADIALLAGDALLTKAFSVIVGNRFFSDHKKTECIRILADACGEHGMLAGQTIDKLSENKRIDFDSLCELHYKKTACMFCAAVQMGCVLGDISADTEKELLKIMNSLGLAFQIKDDILDVTSQSSIIGKPVNSDEKSLKSTFVSLLGIDKSHEMLKNIATDIKNNPIIVEYPFFAELTDFFVNRTI